MNALFERAAKRIVDAWKRVNIFYRYPIELSVIDAKAPLPIFLLHQIDGRRPRAFGGFNDPIAQHRVYLLLDQSVFPPSRFIR